MAHSNQKKPAHQKEYPQHSQLFPYDDFHELKSEFFETFQKNDLKLLSNVHELGLEEFPQPRAFQERDESLYIPKKPSKPNFFNKPLNKYPSNNDIHKHSVSNTLNNVDENYSFPQPHNKISYNSNPFPKVIPDNASNSYADEITQFTTNNNRANNSKNEDLLSTYWGNNYYEEPVKGYDSPLKPQNFDKFEKKIPFIEKNAFFEKNKFERFDEKLHCPNKFHYNPEPEKPYLFSTPPTYKSKSRDYEPEFYNNRYNSSNLGFFRKNNNFSEYFNSGKKFHSHREIEEFSPETKDFDGSYEDNIGRNTRGLKYLTIKVKEIVCGKEKTSYREVADILLNVLNFQAKARYKSESDLKREVQNIKRRAYDALTVLIACGIFEKEGKNIKVNPKCSFLLQNKFNLKNLDETCKNLKANLTEKMKIIENKKTAFKELFLKYLAINNIIQRNISSLDTSFEIKLSKSMNNINRSIENYVQDDDQKIVNFEKKSISEKSEEKNIDEKKDIISSYYQNKYIKFPFIVVEVSDKIALNMNQDKSKLSLHSKNAMKIYGDVDILLQMQMFSKFQKSQPLIKLIPRDIHQYLPSEITEQVR